MSEDIRERMTPGPFKSSGEQELFLDTPVTVVCQDVVICRYGDSSAGLSF